VYTEIDYLVRADDGRGMPLDLAVKIDETDGALSQPRAI
jgi:hypothetical protein